jgi:hypothetical protein
MAIKIRTRRFYRNKEIKFEAVMKTGSEGLLKTNKKYLGIKQRSRWKSKRIIRSGLQGDSASINRKRKVSGSSSSRRKIVSSVLNLLNLKQQQKYSSENIQ